MRLRTAGFFVVGILLGAGLFLGTYMAAPGLVATAAAGARDVVLSLSTGAAQGGTPAVPDAASSPTPTPPRAEPTRPLSPPGLSAPSPERVAPTPIPRAATPTPAPRAAPTEADPLPAIDAGLVARLERLTTLRGLRLDGQLAIAVIDEHGRDILADHAERPLLPASTQKLVTAAAALAVLGPDHRYITRVEATAPVRNGVLRGDLVIVGSGDPALATPRYRRDVDAQRPHTPLATLARRIARSGIRRIEGRVVGDPSAFADEPTAPGWLPRYLTALHTTRVSGLTVDGGRRLFNSRGVLLAEAAQDPAARTARQLTRLLERRGVEVRGKARSSPRPPATRGPITKVASPPLRVLLRHTLQRSDNHMADAIFRSVGAVEGAPTWHGSTSAVQQVLAGLGVASDDVIIADGSGLSRANRLTARFLVQLDHAMTSSDAGRHWADLMAVAGETGTLRRRLVGTAADGRLIGKTGTLRDVRTIAGTVIGPSGHAYHLAVLGNGLDSYPDQLAARRLMDLVGAALAEGLYDCTPRRRAGGDGPGKGKGKHRRAKTLEPAPLSSLRCAA